MKLAPGSAAMTLVLALLTAVGPLSTDMYLPSLPAISSALGATAPAVQLTLSAFLAGFAAGQLVHGPLSDHFGRRPVLLTGLAIFVLGSAACAYARDIEILIVSRFFQAIGASAATVLARAIVRDLHGGKDAARLLSFMGALMGIVPLAVPVFGGYLQTAFGWRASFFTTALLALALMLVSITFLPETLDRTSRGKWQARAMIEDFTGLLASPVFIRYLISICLGFAGLFTFISGSSFVLQNYYGLGEVAFGLAFSFCVAGYISGTLAGAKLTGMIGVERSSMAGEILLGAAGAAMMAFAFFAPHHLLGLLLPMFVFFAGIGLVLPQGMAGALTPFPEKAGTASSLIGFIQMASAAFLGAVIVRFIDNEPRALAWSIGALGITSLVFALVSLRYLNPKQKR